MKNIKAITLLFLLLWASKAEAQQLWTIDDCMRYAVEHNFDVQDSEIEYSNGKSEYKSSIASFFPSVSASVGATYNFGRSIDPATNTYDNLKTFNNSYSLSGSWTLFSGGQLINSFRQAKAQMKKASWSVQGAKDEAAIAVMEAYVNLQYYRALLELAASKLEESKALLNKSLKMKELGLNSAVEVSQAQAQYADDDHNHTTIEGQVKSATITLKQAMNYPVEEPLPLAEPAALSSEALLWGAPQAEGQILEYAMGNNPAVRQAEFNMQASKYELRRARGAMTPSIYLQAGLSDYYYRHFGSQNDNFKEQLDLNFGQYVGVSMSIPIFSSLSRRTSVKRAKNAAMSARNEYDRAMYELNAAIKQAIVDCDNMAKEVEKMEQKSNSDSLAYQLARRKYEEGLMSFLDMRENYNRWFESQAELVRATLTLGIKKRLLEYYRTNTLILN